MIINWLIANLSSLVKQVDQSIRAHINHGPGRSYPAVILIAVMLELGKSLSLTTQLVSPTCGPFEKSLKKEISVQTDLDLE